jgi:two-component system phosphate regulon sensor histidine kinase PhoR
LDVKLEASDHIVSGDREHLQNVFSNLLDNAIKYTLNEPYIKIRTKNTTGGITIDLEDNGIGIRKEHQKHIFKKLYRVPTGNIHESRGFGIGLYYVKAVIVHHKGNITLKSELGKGSLFTIYLPFKH